MVPFLRNANKHFRLNLDDNNLKSEGFNILMRALRDSPIKELYCNRCGIESIEIDIDHFPKQLKVLYLNQNKIADEGVAVLVEPSGAIHH